MSSPEAGEAFIQLLRELDTLFPIEDPEGSSARSIKKIMREDMRFWAQYWADMRVTDPMKTRAYSSFRSSMRQSGLPEDHVIAGLMTLF